MNILMTGCSEESFGGYVRKQLLEQGHKVCGVGLNGPDIQVDLSELHSTNWLWRSAEDLLRGRVDCLINNAGTTHIDFIENHNPYHFRRVLNTNLVAPFLLCRKFVMRWTGDPHNGFRGVGRIINTSSMGAHLALRASPGYCASKAGLEAMTKSLAKELAGKKNIICMCVAPGAVHNTAMADYAVQRLMETRGMTEQEARQYAVQSPMGRNMIWDEVWAMFDYAVNHSTLYSSGSVLTAPGGMGI